MQLFQSVLILGILYAGLANSQPAVGVDNAGTDITPTASASSAVACAQQCDNNAGCAGWSWDSCGKVNCYLKSAVGTRAANSCRVSDVRLGNVGYDRSGYDMPISPVAISVGTASTCAYRCVNTTGCVAWSWTPSNSYCYLKWWASARTASSGVTSGVQGAAALDWASIGNVQATTLPTNASSTDCADLCESTSTCYAWVFQVAGASCTTAANSCWLKGYTAGQGTAGTTCRTAGYASRFYNTTVKGANVTVSSVNLVGNQTDSHLAPLYPNRDGGAVGSLGGKIVWFWSDTQWNEDGTLKAFYDNTYAIGTPSSPVLMNGPERQAIPFTAPETAFNNANSNNPRVVLWPKSGVIETSPGAGYLWCPKGYFGKSAANETNKGIVLSTVIIGSDGYPSVTRLSDVPIFNSSMPSFGGIAAARDQNYLYLFSSNQIAQLTATTFVARAPLTSASTFSSYQYWDNSAKVWSSTVPAINDTSKASFTTALGLDGNVFYSSYHRAWILIYQNGGDYKIYMRTAPAPQGPWTSGTLIYTPPPSPSNNYVYGTTGTNLYDTTGKTASVDFTWQWSGGYANWVTQVNFA